MVKKWQQRTKPLTDAPVGRNVVAVRVPGAGGGMVAQVNRHERHAGLDESSCQKSLLAPQVLAVPLSDRFWLPRQVKGYPGTLTEDQVNGLLAVAVHGLHLARAVELVPDLVE